MRLKLLFLPNMIVMGTMHMQLTLTISRDLQPLRDLLLEAETASMPSTSQDAENSHNIQHKNIFHASTGLLFTSLARAQENIKD
jgi:hypothetical protein